VLYPLTLSRYLSPRLWGGSKLRPLLGIDDDEYNEAEPLGESWQVYEKNRVLNGPLAGKTLEELSQAYGEALVGTSSYRRYGARFPLLAKFIDAADKLSIQVHPDDAYAHAREAETGIGKEEAWYVLAAEPGAHIIWGFKTRVTPEEVRRAALGGSLEGLVNYVPVSPGDVIYNPAGTLHAIGAGILLFEIQQSSDLTYRLYDYGRRDAAGRPRELHLDKALEVLDYTPGDRAKVSPERLDELHSSLVKSPFFAMERWRLAGDLERTTAPASAEIWTVVAGEAKISAGEPALALKTGESVVLPAALGAYGLAGEGELLRCYVPG
jgi:mannose-6-phosphate isomerase